MSGLAYIGQENIESMPILNFDSFINESKQHDIVDILILSGTKNPSSTVKSFQQECNKRGIVCNVVNVHNCKIEKIYNGHVIKETGGSNKEILISPETTAIIPRRGVIFNSHTKQIMRELESFRYFCVNTLESIEICENKYLTCNVLERHNIPVPRYALVKGEENLDDALAKVGGKFPVVMKLLSGTQGIGVLVVDSYPSLKSVYQTLEKIDPEKEILIQEKINSNFDFRVQVIVKKFDPLISDIDNLSVLGSMKRMAVENDFRTNFSLGGKVSSFEIDDDIAKLALDAANAVGSHWCGVDIMIDSDTKKPYVLEVNSSPGTKGISQAIGKPIVGEVIDYVTNKRNWTYSKMEIGYLETIEVPEIGKMVAKFDTGNGTKASSIHADSVEEKDGVLYWTIGKKSFKNKIMGYTKTEVGKDIETRPYVYMDLMFNGIMMHNVKVAPLDRKSKSTPFLASRGLMKKMGVMVNPHKAFVVTERIPNYKPQEAKKYAHGGINFL